jgi:hypothetical protein
LPLFLQSNSKIDYNQPIVSDRANLRVNLVVAAGSFPKREWAEGAGGNAGASRVWKGNSDS